MNRSALPGWVFLVMGLILAVLPLGLLPVCEGGVVTASGATIPMKCFWTARAEVGTGALVALGGVLYCLIPNQGARLGIAAMNGGTAILAMAFPTRIIGGCGSEAMPCRIGTLPGLMVVSSLILLAALVTCLWLARSLKRRQCL